MTALPSPSCSAHAELGLLDVAGRLAYDQDRLDYHSRLIVVATPVVRQVYATGRRLVLLNRHQVSARRGLIVTGAAGTGKTTAVTQLGRNHELLLRQPARRGRPPPGVSPWSTSPSLPRPRRRCWPPSSPASPGLPQAHRQNQAEITNAVCDVMSRLRADLVLIDEIHNLKLATRAWR